MTKDTPAIKMKFKTATFDVLHYADGYGTKLEILARPDLMTPRGMTLLKETLEMIEQLTKETI